MLKIRLSLTGTTNRRMHRIVAIEEGKRRDGRAIEILGHINRLLLPPKIEIKRDRIRYWQSKGAQLTPAVKKLLDEKIP